MATLNPLSTVGTTAVVLQSDLNDDWTYMAGSGHYRTADLLAALDAVPKMPEKPPLADRERDLLGPQNDDGRYWHGRAMENLRKAELATTRAENVEAERDALAATVERVRALLPDLEANIPYDNGNATANRIGQMLRAALDPKPAFVLPTEAGAGIMATDSGPRCYEREYRLFADGMWHGVDGSVLHPKTLMANYIAHRLIEDVA